MGRPSSVLLGAAHAAANFRIASGEEVILTITGWSEEAMMVIPFHGTADDKPMFFSVVREVFRVHEVTEYFASAESWMYVGKNGDDDEYMTKITSGELHVHELPERLRQEVIVFAHVNRAGIVGSWISKIDREKGCVEIPEPAPAVGASGRLLELLQPPIYMDDTEN